MHVELVQSLLAVPAARWDALAQGDVFASHAFLLALEQSGSATAATGWSPRHLVARDGGGRALGAMPLYLKDHSFGEFVFDWSWAELSAVRGRPYYPKLVCAVPFTPVSGPRLLVPPGPRRQHVARLLLQRAQQLAQQEGASSLHLLFTSEQDQLLLAQQPDVVWRQGYQFHWTNHGYQSFEHYLASLRSSARKRVRRERRRAAASGLQLQWALGSELSDEQWQALYRFYRHTVRRKGSPAYLTRDFFHRLRRRLAHHTVVTLAMDRGRPVAGTLNLHDGRVLYGRYWGSLVQADSLHFELCYHMPIEICIAKGWQRFEAGAQGVHKLKRGLMPRATSSAHWFSEATLGQLVGRLLQRERDLVAQEMALAAHHGPYRRDGGAAAPSRRDAALAPPAASARPSATAAPPPAARNGQSVR